MRPFQLISVFTTNDSSNYVQCDVVKLNELLRSEMLSLLGTSFPGRTHAFHDVATVALPPRYWFHSLRLQEIEKVLDCVVQYNRLQRTIHVKRHVFDAWRQLVEVALGLCSLDAFSVEQRVSIVASVLVDLLNVVARRGREAKIWTAVCVEELDESASRCAASVALTLSTVLRRQFQADVKWSDEAAGTSFAPYASTLDGSFVRGLAALRHLAVLTAAFDLLLGALTRAGDSPLSSAQLRTRQRFVLRIQALAGCSLARVRRSAELCALDVAASR